MDDILVHVLVGPPELEETRAAQRDMYAALKARKEALEEALRKKTEELKALCLNEAVSALLSLFNRGITLFQLL